MPPTPDDAESSDATAAGPDRCVYEMHLHTSLCKHAEGPLEAYAEAALRRNLAGITVTCHCPMPDGHSAGIRMAPEQFPEYVAMVERLKEKFAGRLDVRLGLECDFFPGYEDDVERLLWRADFDFVLGSVHPHMREYREAYWMGDPQAFTHCYFEHLAQSAESGLFDSLAHPDLVKNLVRDDWNPAGVVPLIGGYLDRIARTGVCMELNTSGVYKSYPEFNPGPGLLRAMRVRDIPVTVGADAHQAWRVGDRFEEAYDALEHAGYEQVSFFARRERYEVPIEQARGSLRSDNPETASRREADLQSTPH